MNILVAFNDKYFCPAKTMLTSFCENNEGIHSVYLMYSALNEKFIKELKKYLYEKYKCTLFPIRVCEEDFDGFPLGMHFTIEVYYRFLTQDVLPSDIDRVLWLDSDMIVMKNLHDLYYQSFDDKSIIVSRTRTKNPKETLDRLKLPAEVGYFNSGMILFNLSRIREKGITSKTYFSYVKNNSNIIKWPDQDVLNVIYAYDKKEVDNEIYNKQIFSNDLLSKEQYRFIDKNTAILHYIGPVKPWNVRYYNKCYRYYRRYLRIYEPRVKALFVDAFFSFINFVHRFIKQIVLLGNRK